MKKLLRLSIIISFLLVHSLMVYAGNINENEQRVVDASYGTFEIDGKKYKATSAAINKLIDYLNQDDVNLSASQADKAIADLPSYLRMGLEQDALVPIDNGNGTNNNSSTTTDPVVVAVPESESENINSNDVNAEITKEEAISVLNKKLEEEGLKTVSIEEETAGAAGSETEDNQKEVIETISPEKEELVPVTDIEESSEEEVDYSDARPLKKGFDIVTAAVIIVVIVIAAGAIIIYCHRNRFNK